MKFTSVAFIVLVCIALIRAGEGTQEEGRPCPMPCQRKFAPVCGSQGGKSRTFGNECVWRNHNCEHEDDAYPEMQPGRCPENSDSS